MGVPERPLVSTVLITRDRPDQLRAAVESVRDQTYPNLELLVVDGSESAVESLVRRHAGDRPVTYLRDSGEGAGAARNIGIRAATGEYVAFLDDDDEWLPEKTERQVDTFAPGVGTVYTGQFTVRDGQRISGRTPSLSGQITEELLRGVALCPTSTIMVRRDLIEAAGGFDPALPIWEDREWYIRLSQYGMFRPVAAELVRRGFGDYEQLTDDLAAARDIAYPRFIEKHRELAAEYGPACERALIASMSQKLAAISLEQGRYGDARRFVLRSLRHDPFRRQAWLYLSVSLGGRPAYAIARRLRRALTKCRPTNE